MRSARRHDAYKVVVRIPIPDDMRVSAMGDLRRILDLDYEEWEVTSAGIDGVRASCFVPVARAEDQGALQTMLQAGRTVERALGRYTYYGHAAIHGKEWVRWPDDDAEDDQDGA